MSWDAMHNSGSRLRINNRLVDTNLDVPSTPAEPGDWSYTEPIILKIFNNNELQHFKIESDTSAFSVVSGPVPEYRVMFTVPTTEAHWTSFEHMPDNMDDFQCMDGEYLWSRRWILWGSTPTAHRRRVDGMLMERGEPATQAAAAPHTTAIIETTVEILTVKAPPAIPDTIFAPKAPPAMPTATFAPKSAAGNANCQFCAKSTAGNANCHFCAKSAAGNARCGLPASLSQKTPESGRPYSQSRG